MIATQFDIGAEVFTVMKPDEFEANIEDVKRRVDHSRSELSPGERETWLDFGFYPAVPDNDLERLQETSRELAALVDAGQTGPIDCLPLYFAQIQLGIYLTLLLGDHAGTGRALTAYAAVVQGVSDHVGSTGEWADALTDEDRPQLLTTLAKHRGFSEYAGRRLLAYGRSHEFADESAQANATWDAIFDATCGSVDDVFTSRGVGRQS